MHHPSAIERRLLDARHDADDTSQDQALLKEVEKGKMTNVRKNHHKYHVHCEPAQLQSKGLTIHAREEEGSLAYRHVELGLAVLHH